MYLTLFFFNDTATTEIYTLSLHDALPISRAEVGVRALRRHHERRGHSNRPPAWPERSGYARTGNVADQHGQAGRDRKSTRLNSSHVEISYAVFCLKKKKKRLNITYN